MIASVIAIPNHPVSQKAAALCIESSEKVGNNFKLYQFEAITPERVDEAMKKFNIKWNYPWEGQVTDFASGLKKSAYRTANKLARVACAVSHYSLWNACAHGDDPHLIMEHDAIFTSKFDTNIIEKSKFLILGINNPIGATRKARVFYDKVVENKNRSVISAPWIDDMNIPQGLAGNSAYIIKPEGARKMLKLVDEFGLWPNDALMCKQLIPQLGVTTKFYTTVQGTPSTTSD